MSEQKIGLVTEPWIPTTTANRFYNCWMSAPDGAKVRLGPQGPQHAWDLGRCACFGCGYTFEELDRGVQRWTACQMKPDRKPRWPE